MSKVNGLDYFFVLFLLLTSSMIGFVFTGDLFNFIKNIECLVKEIYLNFSFDIEGYKIEPLIFSNQKDNYQHYKIKTIEKVW